MERSSELLGRLACEEGLILAVFSAPRKKSDPVRKVSLRPVVIKGALHYQAELAFEKKVTHENLLPAEVERFCADLMHDSFKQANVFSTEADYTVLANKPDHEKIVRKAPTKKMGSLSHDREKHYAIPDGKPVDFLVRLGVQTKDGQVVPKYRSKFRQINRFLEIAEDCLEYLPKEPSIIDFGCGKSYLTFALYWYLNIKNDFKAKLTGLDLKEDVIAFCNSVAVDLGYTDLQFLVGDIAQYDEKAKADMVVTLHACDTATDFALQKAHRWNAKVILSVPCCQHELNRQIRRPDQEMILSHGILRERFSAILTDALRAAKLTEWGYKVDMIEFTTLEHTAKNIMLRCIAGKASPADRRKAQADFRKQCEYWHVSPTIGGNE
ncbi:MAG: SAM-dependent methyltransferase [Firmicutes bacterium]|nr:SAM-dependent methyltransferase [Bacillota bacterium]